MEGYQVFELMLAGTYDNAKDFVSNLLAEYADDTGFLSMINISVNSRDYSDYVDADDFIEDAFRLDIIEDAAISDIDGEFDKGDCCCVQLTFNANSEEGDELFEDFPREAQRLCEDIAVTAACLKIFGRYYEFDYDNDYTAAYLVQKDCDCSDCSFESMADPTDFPSDEFYAWDAEAIFGEETDLSYSDYDGDNYGYEE